MIIAVVVSLLALFAVQTTASADDGTGMTYNGTPTAQH
jgi:hypothetical protein